MYSLLLDTAALRALSGRARECVYVYMYVRNQFPITAAIFSLHVYVYPYHTSWAPNWPRLGQNSQ